MRLRQIFESTELEVAIIFGRFNPPHKGHKAAWELASQSDHWFVGTNQSTQGPKDPLPYDVKVKAMEAIWPDVSEHIVPTMGWLTLASKVYEKYGDAKLLCLTDEDWVTKTIQQYNGKEGQHGYYKFSNIEHKPTPRLSSATDLRNAVQAGDREMFAKAAGVSADTQVDGKPFFDLVAEYLLPYAEKEKAKAEKKKKVADDAKKESVAEATDPNFLKFMNKSLGDKVDSAPATKKTGLDSYDNAKLMGQDSAGYSEALKFSVTTLQKLTPGQKVKLATRGEDGVVTWLTNQATKQGLVPDTFVEEDIDESQDFLSDIFKDPAITSWALLLTNGDPLPKPPAKAPFKIVMNKGIAPYKNSDGTMNGGGYRPGDDDVVDVVDSKPEADDMFDGLVSKNPTYYFWMRDANGKLLKQHQPNNRPKTQGVAEGVAETLPMHDAVKVLRQYGADHFKTTSNELRFYKQGRPFSVGLIWGNEGERSVNLSQLNSATRQLKGQGVAEHNGVQHKYQMTHPDGTKMKFTASDDADAKRQAREHSATSLSKLKK